MSRDHIEGWLRSIRLAHIAHARCAAHNARLNRAMGMPVVLLTAVVGSTVFASMGNSPSAAVVILTGSLSILATVLSSLQTFLNYSGLAGQHKVAAANYGKLRREIEEVLIDPPVTPEDLRSFMREFKERWAQVEQESPTIPQTIHEQSHEQLLQFLREEAARAATRLSSQVLVSVQRSEGDGGKVVARLVLIRGLPGSGKSTLARAMTGHVHVEADMFFEMSGTYVFDAAQLPAAHAWCLERTKELLGDGKSVVVSNTFTRNVEMLPYFHLGFPVSVIEANGQWESVHHVPSNHIELMRSKWETLAIGSVARGL